MKHSALKITLGALAILILVASVSCAATEPAPTAQAEPEQEAAQTQEAAPTQEATQAPTQEVTQAQPAQEPESLNLTLDELAEYDGSDGNPTYIAVQGIIYDVSAITAWMGGKHQGYFAGQDVTEKINDISPHGVSVLSNLPKVGKIVE